MNKDIQKQTLYWTNIKCYISKHTKNLVEHSIDSCLPVPSFQTLILPQVPLHTEQEKAAKLPQRANVYLKHPKWMYKCSVENTKYRKTVCKF